MSLTGERPPYSGVTEPPKPPPLQHVQDGPPPGGYPRLDVRRNLPRNVGPSATALFLGSALVMAYGFWRMGNYNLHRRELLEERRQVRAALAPFLQAEEDERYLKAKAQWEAWEAKVMEHVPDWEKKREPIYKTRSHGPTYVFPF
jgi:NADH dehydrogenase (ubiquinone) 1 alpha subcomplex subunit 13